jgi:hypothetical protein
LAGTWFEGVAFVAFVLSGVVLKEPAPFDLLVMALLGVGLLNGKLPLQRLRHATAIHLTVWVFVLSNFVPLNGSLLFIFVSLYMFALMYFMRMYVTSRERMFGVLLGYWVAGLISVLAALFSEVTGIGHDLIWYSGGTRARGFFKDPNVFSTFLLPLLLLMIDEIVDPAFTHRRWPTWVKLVSVLLLVGGIFFSYSRSAWVNTALALLIYGTLLALRGKRQHGLRLLRFILVIGTASVVGITVLLLSRPEMLNLFQARAQVTQSYDNERFSTHLEGLYIALDTPQGIGPVRFPGAHQLYIKTLTEQGMLGLLPLILLLVIFGFNIWRLAWQEKEKCYGLSAKVLFAVWITFVINGFVIDMIHWRHFFVALGLIWALMPPATKTSPGSS